MRVADTREVKVRRFSWFRWTAAAALTASGLTLVGARPALASCHAFNVSASPSTVTEGGTVTVTVTRDGAAAPSAVHVSTSNGSAIGGQDYESVNRDVSFTSGTSASFPLKTFADTASESNETFSIRLSEAADGGCDGDTLPEDFSFGGPAGVTIADKAPAAPPTTAKPAVTAATVRGTTSTAKKGAATTTTRKTTGTTTTLANSSDTTAVVSTTTTRARRAAATTTTTEAVVTITKDEGGELSAGVTVGLVAGLLALATMVVVSSARRPLP
jgi:hypothetical protein